MEYFQGIFCDVTRKVFILIIISFFKDGDLFKYNEDNDLSEKEAFFFFFFFFLFKNRVF